jgi:L-threonylcarbamoyladenylate synthase
MQEISTVLKNGGIGIIATDTIYGIVGQALNSKPVERIYNIKKRTPAKPFIILISKIEDVLQFGIGIDSSLTKKLDNYWPGPVSIILDCPGDTFTYLHRGTHTLAFRLPAKDELRALIRRTGPLVAPSANPEGFPPATNITEAKQYFADNVNFYESGQVSDTPSKIIRIIGDTIEIIRA